MLLDAEGQELEGQASGSSRSFIVAEPDSDGLWRPQRCVGNFTTRAITLQAMVLDVMLTAITGSRVVWMTC